MRAELLVALLLGGCFAGHGTGSDGGVAVDAGVGDAAGPPADGRPVVGGEDCGDAPLITAGRYLGTTAGAANSLDTNDPSCDSVGSAAPDVVYRVAVDAGQRLTVGVQAEHDALVMFTTQLQCEGGPSACLVGSDAGDDGEPDAASWVNDGGATEVYVIVDATNADQRGAFELDVRVDAAARGEACADAIVLPTIDAVLTFQTTVGFAEDEVLCAAAGEVTSNDVSYRLDVPAGTSYDVAFDPVFATDVRIAVFDQGEGDLCPAPDGPASCTTVVDTKGEGGQEVVTIASSPVARAVFLGVEQGPGMRPGAFKITVDAR